MLNKLNLVAIEEASYIFNEKIREQKNKNMTRLDKATHPTMATGSYYSFDFIE